MVYTIDELKNIISPIAIQYGLRAVYVFGSYATGTAHSESDVDILVDTNGTNLTSLFTLGALYCDLENALGKNIDLLTLNSLEQEHRFESDLEFRRRLEEERTEIYAVA